jgi:hypothetical protein
MVLKGIDYRFNIEEVGFTGIKLCKTIAKEPHPLLFKDPLRLDDETFMKLCQMVSRFNGQYVISNGNLYVVFEDKDTSENVRMFFKHILAHLYYLDITPKEVEEIWEY